MTGAANVSASALPPLGSNSPDGAGSFDQSGAFYSQSAPHSRNAGTDPGGGLPLCRGHLFDRRGLLPPLDSLQGGRVAPVEWPPLLLLELPGGGKSPPGFFQVAA